MSNKPVAITEFTVRGALLLFALAGPQAAAQDYCGNSSFIDCLENGTIGYGTPATIEGVETIAPLDDSNGDGVIDAKDASWQLYEKLLGPRYTMPDSPRVRIIMNDLRLGHEVPVVQDMGPAEYDGRYLEFGIQLLAQYGPHVAWRDVRLWLNNIAGFETGRQGTIAKFLAEMVYEQNPRRREGYGTAYAGPNGDSFVFRGDWRPAADALLALYPPDPALGRRTSDGSEDGDEWPGSVSIGQFTTLPSVPYDWLLGVDAPNPSAPDQTVRPVYLRFQMNPDFDLFNDPPPQRRSYADPDPLPDMFDEAAGESWSTIIDVDQELLGLQYGPFHGTLLAEGADVTADGPCAERSQCEGGPYRDSRDGRERGASAATTAPGLATGGTVSWLLVLASLLACRRRSRSRGDAHR